jgi:hypothetical protein
MNARQRADDESHQRNISEMFLDFADPIVETLPEDGNAAQMEHALKIAYTMWNAMVLEEVKGDRHTLDLLHAAVVQHPEATILINALIDRKQTLFGSDHRLIGTYHVITKHGQLILRTDVRDPVVSTT